MTHTDATYYRAILDAIPPPVFIVDGDVRIRDVNTTASRTPGARKADVYFVRGGDALHRLHSSDVPQGSGPARRTSRVHDYSLADSAEPGLVPIALENITEISTLKDIIPICMGCRKVRDDRQYWEQVEGYLLKHAGLVFSHGLSSPCAEKAVSQIGLRPGEQA